MLSIVMVSGLLLGSIGSDVFAVKVGEEGHKGQYNGCAIANDKAKEKVKDKNPHCEDDENGTGHSGSIPLTNTCDDNDDGAITLTELIANEGPFGPTFITAIEGVVDSNDGNVTLDGEIDTGDEWTQLQIEKPGICT